MGKPAVQWPPIIEPVLGEGTPGLFRDSMGEEYVGIARFHELHDECDRLASELNEAEIQCVEAEAELAPYRELVERLAGLGGARMALARRDPDTLRELIAAARVVIERTD